MALRWTSSARSDLVRLHEFLQAVNVPAAARVVRQLVAGAKRIPAYPRLGTRLAEFEPRECTRILMRDYEIRYEVADADVFVLQDLPRARRSLNLSVPCAPFPVIRFHTCVPKRTFSR